MKNSITEMKNTLEGINSILGVTEEGISGPEDRIMEITQSEEQKEIFFLKLKQFKASLDTIKCTNIHIIGVPEGEKRRESNIFDEIMAEKFPMLKKETDIQVEEAQRIPNKMNPNRPTPRHITKMAKVKENYKGNKRKAKRHIQGNPLKLLADFSAETLQARREWHYIFKVLEGKNQQPRILCPAILSFKIEREIKNFSDKLKEFINTKPTLKEMLKSLL